MRWVASLTKLRNFEIEALRKRLGEILERRSGLEARLRDLDAEAGREADHARGDAQAGWYLVGFRAGWRTRRAAVEAELRTLDAEERGARDALSEAFEALKKVETVGEAAATAEAREQARREGQALDEQALRRRAVF